MPTIFPIESMLYHFHFFKPVVFQIIENVYILELSYTIKVNYGGAGSPDNIDIDGNADRDIKGWTYAKLGVVQIFNDGLVTGYQSMQ